MKDEIREQIRLLDERLKELLEMSTRVDLIIKETKTLRLNLSKKEAEANV